MCQSNHHRRYLTENPPVKSSIRLIFCGFVGLLLAASYGRGFWTLPSVHGRWFPVCSGVPSAGASGGQSFSAISVAPSTSSRASRTHASHLSDNSMPSLEIQYRSYVHHAHVWDCDTFLSFHSWFGTAVLRRPSSFREEGT